MKTYVVRYTEDRGETFHVIFVSASTYTEAYVKVDKTLSPSGAITDLFELI